MTMKAYNADIFQAVKWLQNKAPKLNSIIRSKGDWYQNYNDNFWSQWTTNVFDLRTANSFGLQVWCIILGLPSAGLGLYPVTHAWAYGRNRQNFVYSGLDTSIPEADRNIIGGNFYGGGDTEVLRIDDIRKILQLRYVSLISNGSIEFINEMLRFIWNDGNDWDYTTGNFVYLVDDTVVPNYKIGNHTTSLPAAGTDLEYRFGPAVDISDSAINLMNSGIGILPTFIGANSKALKVTS